MSSCAYSPPTTDNEHILIFSFKKKMPAIPSIKSGCLFSIPTHPTPSHHLRFSKVKVSRYCGAVVFEVCPDCSNLSIVSCLFFTLMEELAGHFDAVHCLHLQCTSLLCCLFIIYGHCQSGLEESNLQFCVMGRMRTAVRFN